MEFKGRAKAIEWERINDLIELILLQKRNNPGEIFFLNHFLKVKQY
jgi:hypothetical protein